MNNRQQTSGGGIGFFGGLALVFITLKLMGYITWSWWSFTRKWEMQPYIDLAEKYGWTVFVIHCENKFQNIHGVGVGTLDAMARRWEAY